MLPIDTIFSNEPLYINNVLIPGRIFLAPLDGFTDSPFRVICRQFGAALCPSEFINGIDVNNGHPHLKNKTHFLPIERPFCYQIYDDDPERILKAARKLMDNNPDLLDINMGCSARNVSNRGAGAGLLKDPTKIAKIASSLVREMPIPVTAKIRLGWDENTRNYLEITRILQDCGISAITVHARTRKQEYRGTADWDAIGEIKQIASVPIIGNGDIDSLETALTRIKETQCDAVMIGRAALGNPWVFSGVDRNGLPREEFINGIERHLTGMTSLYGTRLGTVLFRRHLSKYYSDLPLSLVEKQSLYAFETPVLLMNYLKSMILKGRIP